MGTFTSGSHLKELIGIFGSGNIDSNSVRNLRNEVRLIAIDTQSNTQVLKGSSNWDFASNATVYTFLSLEAHVQQLKARIAPFEANSAYAAADDVT